MKLSKSYSGKFFLKHTLEEAVQNWLHHHDADLASSEFLLLETEEGNETWSHDTYSDFLEEYAPTKDRIHFSLRLPDEKVGFSLLFHYYTTQINVNSPTKESIDFMTSFFDSCKEGDDFLRINRDHRIKDASIRHGESSYREERRMEIDLRVITGDDLLKLAREIFLCEFGESNEYIERLISLQWDDGSSWEAHDLNAVETEIKSARKRLISVEIESYSSELGSRIQCRLTHANSGSGSGVVVTGYDKRWIADNYLRLNELIESFERQKRVPSGVDFFLVLSLGILTGWMLYSLAGVAKNAIYPSTSELEGNPETAISIFLILAFPIGMIVGLSGGAVLSNYIRSAYPRIELQVGPMHQNLSKMRRNLLWTVASIVAIPILVQLFF